MENDYLYNKQKAITAAKKFACELDKLFKDFYANEIKDELNPLILLIDDLDIFQKNGNKCSKNDFITINNGLLFVGLWNALEPVIPLQG